MSLQWLKKNWNWMKIFCYSKQKVIVGTKQLFFLSITLFWLLRLGTEFIYWFIIFFLPLAWYIYAISSIVSYCLVLEKLLTLSWRWPFLIESWDSAHQWTGFYMITTSAMKELNESDNNFQAWANTTSILLWSNESLSKLTH